MDYVYLLHHKQRGIATVTINRPELLNALNAEVYDELYELFGIIEDDPETSVVILTGSGEKAFAAGADIAYMQSRDSFGIREITYKARRASDKVSHLNKPVIAAINGFALGGGCELAMCCDLRIAAEHAKFGQPEINLGIIPGAGGTQRLTQLVGITKAKELIYTGDIIDAITAQTIGLVNKVVPIEHLISEATALAEKLLQKSSIALFLAKEAITKGSYMNLSSGLDLEAQCFALCFATEDQKEGMAAFLEKRVPEFKGK